MEVILGGKKQRNEIILEKSNFLQRKTLIDDICELENQSCFIKLSFDLKKMRNVTIQKKVGS